MIKSNRLKLLFGLIQLIGSTLNLMKVDPD